MDTADMATVEREAIEEMNGMIEKHGFGGLGTVELTLDEEERLASPTDDELAEMASALPIQDAGKIPGAAEERLAEIRECGQRLYEAKREMDSAKEEAKEKKKIWEGVAQELCDLVREGDPAMPLFDSPPVAKEGLPPPPPGDDSWKATPLGEALPDLTETVQRKLVEAGIDTMGKLAAWTTVEFSPGRFQALSDIKGVGKGTAEKIEDACQAFWARQAEAKEAEPEEALGGS